MCELMGFHFVRPMTADFTIREFGRRGEDNADGWGIAWYPDRAAAVIKEPRKWKSSQHSGFLEAYPGIRSTLCIAHVRHLTTGTPTFSDTHPFVRELDGVDYCFAHNGTIKDLSPLTSQRFRPVGQTDSERLFCHLLETIAGWDGRLEAPSNWSLLHRKLQEWNSLGTINLLLADGARLFVYHDRTAWKGLQRRPVMVMEGESGHFEDCDMKIDFDTAANHGIVVATSRLSLTGWQRFQPGELIVLQEGRIAYSSHSHIEGFDSHHANGAVEMPMANSHERSTNSHRTVVSG